MRRIAQGMAFALAALFMAMYVWGATMMSAPVSGGSLAAVVMADPAEAKTLYMQNCARCHGADGRGETPLGKPLGATDLSAASWQKRVSDKRMIASITHGRHRLMPAFGKKLSREEISLLVTYVRSLRK